MTAIPTFSTPETTAPLPQRHGWTPERKVLFLDALARRGNVRLACRAAGISAEAAYLLRRREALFADGWQAALVLARDQVEQVLADRAIDGVEEAVFYHGEVVATRRRFDSRLLLAHLARLDRAAEQARAADHAARFDLLLGCLAGVPVPEELLAAGEEGEEADPVPLSRARCCAAAVEALLADEEDAALCDDDDDALWDDDLVDHEPEDHDYDDDDFPPPEEEDYSDLGGDDADPDEATDAEAALAATAAAWDAWYAEVMARLDAVLDAPVGSGAGAGPEFKSRDGVLFGQACAFRLGTLSTCQPRPLRRGASL